MFDMDDISGEQVVSREINTSRNEIVDEPLDISGVYLFNREQRAEHLLNKPKKKTVENVLHESFQPKSVGSGFKYFPSHRPSSVYKQQDETEGNNRWRWGELPTQECLLNDERLECGIHQGDKNKNSVNLTLEENNQELASNDDQPRKIDSGCEEEEDSDISKLLSKHIPDLAASLCGGISDISEISPEQFQLKILDFSEFLARIHAGSLLGDPNLVFRINGKYINWEKAAPILFSVIFFQQSLPKELVSEITKGAVTDTCIKETVTPCFQKSLRLSSEKLSELRLKPGKNEMELSVTTALQGTTRCRCNIYLWHHQDKVGITVGCHTAF